MSIKTTALVAVLTWLAAVAPPAYAAGTPTRLPAPTLRADATRAAPAPHARTRAQLDDEAARYARREARAKKQADYKGGDMLVIGISTGAAIVVLVIVLLLL